MRTDEAGEIADQRAVRHQRALRIAGRSAGVDDHRRVVGSGIDRRVARRCVFEHGMPVPDAVGSGHRRIDVDADDVAQRRQAVANLEQLRQRRLVDDGDVRTGIAETVFERLRPEQMGQRQCDSAHLVDRDMRDPGLRTLRQDDGDPVAEKGAERTKYVGEPVCGTLDVPECPRRGVTRIVLEIERKATTIMCPATADIDPDVVALGHLPGKAVAQRAIAVGTDVEMHDHG